MNIRKIIQNIEDEKKAKLIAAVRHLTNAYFPPKNLRELEAEVLIELQTQRIEEQSKRIAEVAYSSAVQRGIEKATLSLEIPGPKSKRKPKATWRTELSYIAQVYCESTQTNPIGLWRELKARAKSDASPFCVGRGSERDKLIVKTSGATLALKTLQNEMPSVRTEAIRLKERK